MKTTDLCHKRDRVTKKMKAKQITALALIGLVIFSMIYVGCNTNDPPEKIKPNTVPKTEVPSPEFQSDSAFAYVKKQVDFGPRVPNSSSHIACGDWIVSQMKSCGATVIEQSATIKAFDGTPLKMRNIIASFQPEKKQRVLLCAHWDTRPFADKDPDKSFEKKPIDGANDGASGVAVLMEIAKRIQEKPTGIGIDIIFFDAEDYGKAEFVPDETKEVLNDNFFTSWCLGSQYWALNKHVANYNPRFAILLDMVGAGDAQFNKEKFSLEAAEDVVGLVWNTGAKLGYTVFQDQEVEGVIDDHVMLNRAGVRCIDIIDTRPQIATMGLGGYKFGSYHHTHKDNMDVIDRTTLKAVGQTLLQVIYNQ